MTRVTHIDEENHPELAGLIAKIKGARGGRLLNFYRALLHNPALAATWMELNNAVRQQTDIDGRVRELTIMRVAILNRVDYVLDIHKARYGPQAGVTPEEADALADWRDSGRFGARERAVLAYVDAMTRDVAVPDAVFKALREHYTERQAVELTVLVAAYNMHTRMLK